MMAYLESLGYTILRWAEWCEDHTEYTVVSPTGEVQTAEAEWLLVPTLAPIHGPRSGQHAPVWYLSAA